MESGIYRAKLQLDGNFTTIPNNWIRSTGLSVNANFLLIYLLTHEIGYKITFGQIRREIKMGDTAIASAAKELKAAGWLETHRTHDERGYNSGLAWILTNPDHANPDLANPSLDSKGAYIENKDIENTKTPRTLDQDTAAAFGRFWDLYPRRIGKQAALRAFHRASKQTPVATILAGVERLSTDPNLPPKQYIPHPATWINDGRWDDEPYSSRSNKSAKDDNRARAAQILREIGESK